MKILDATSGSRTMWFNKKHHDVIYFDKRNEYHEMIVNNGTKKICEVRPDCMGDFTKLPFSNNSFYLVVFDPPHYSKLSKNSWLAKKYGRLFPGWEAEIKGGFDECMRVLKPNGTLIFKWCSGEYPLKYIIDIIGYDPLFGHTTDKKSHTHWMTFMKTV